MYQYKLSKNLQLSPLRSTSLLASPIEHTAQCINDLQRLLTALRHTLINESSIIIPIPEVLRNCARIKFSNTNGIEISIACPIDVNIPYKTNYWAELSLMCNGILWYDQNTGYEDVCRFFSYNEIVDEIYRLSKYYNDNPLTI